MYKCTIVDRNDMSNIRKVEFVSPHICYATPHAQRTFAIELIFNFFLEIDGTKEDAIRDTIAYFGTDQINKYLESPKPNIKFESDILWNDLDIFHSVFRKECDGRNISRVERDPFYLCVIEDTDIFGRTKSPLCWEIDIPQQLYYETIE